MAAIGGDEVGLSGEAKTGRSDIDPLLLGLATPLAVVVAAVAVRALFIALTPSDAVSGDLSINWTAVANALQRHKNPYHATEYLNWPPLWMQLVYALRQFSRWSSVPWFLTVRLFTAAMDVAGIGVAAWLLARRDRRANLALLLAWALNPSAVLISCQHCNFDALVALWCVLAIASLVAFVDSRSAIDWLLACTFVGLGILTKTVPVVLVALLMGGARVVGGKARALGAFVTFAPITLGMSIIYVLTPGDVTAKVLKYRSYGGYYGISGLLQWFDASDIAAAYARAFPLLLLFAIGWIARLCWRDRLGAQGYIVAAGWLLLFVPTLGPGYGPQYAAWSTPFLALSLGFVTGVSRWVSIAQMVVTACTQIIEYGLLPSHGALWLKLWSSQRLERWSAAGFTQSGQTTIRLALFVVSLVWLATAAWELRKLGAVRRSSAT